MRKHILYCRGYILLLVCHTPNGYDLLSRTPKSFMAMLSPASVLPGIAVVLLLLCAGAPAQNATLEKNAALEKESASIADKLFAEVPFEQWLAEGQRQELSWRVSLSADQLSLHQRIVLHVHATVSAGELKKHAHLLALLRITDANRKEFKNYGTVDTTALDLPHLKEVTLDWSAFVLPGEYKIALALSDLSAGQHGMVLKKLHVNGLGHDPLPGIWTNLPSVEFWAPFREFGLDQSFHSDIKGRLNLPLATKRPVHLDVLADVTPSELFTGHQGAYTRYLFGVLATWKDFSQIEPAGGSINGALLDLKQQKVIWEQKNISTVDWAGMKNALGEKTAGLVSAKDLQNRYNPVFLREELARRASESTGDALHVIVLIGGPLGAYNFPRLNPIQVSNENTVIYFLQFESQEHLAGNRPISNRAISTPVISNRPISHMREMLSPLRVRVLRLTSAADIRRALALIMNEIAQTQ